MMGCAMVSSQPFYRYSNGRFEPRPTPPAYIARAEQLSEADSGLDWHAAIAKAGLNPISIPSGIDDAAYEVTVWETAEKCFYAECWNANQRLWSAEFDQSDFPAFLAQFVWPALQTSAALATREALEAKIPVRKVTG